MRCPNCGAHGLEEQENAGECVAPERERIIQISWREDNDGAKVSYIIVSPVELIWTPNNLTVRTRAGSLRMFQPDATIEWL